MEAGSSLNSSGDEPTVLIINRIRAGDSKARDVLLRRYLPILRRWAHGRLPPSVRTINETDDLVQVTLVGMLKNIDQLRLEHQGSFFLYLKQALLNRIRDEVRAYRRQCGIVSNEHEVDSIEVGVPDAAIDFEHIQAYEKALTCLPKRQQQLVVMRLEFGMSYSEIGKELGGTPDAVRMMISRALSDLAKSLAHEN